MRCEVSSPEACCSTMGRISFSSRVGVLGRLIQSQMAAQAIQMEKTIRVVGLFDKRSRYGQLFERRGKMRGGRCDRHAEEGSKQEEEE